MVTPSLPCGDHAVTALPAAQAAVAVATIEGLHNDLATARARAAELEVGIARVALPLIHCMPGSRRGSARLFLKR